VRVMGLPLWFPGNFVTDIETRGSFFSRNRSERQHQEQLHHAAPLVARAEIRASRLGICSYYRWLCVVGATMSIFSLHRSLTLSALLIMMLAIVSGKALAHVEVLTQHNDPQRSAANNAERLIVKNGKGGLCAFPVVADEHRDIAAPVVVEILDTPFAAAVAIFEDVEELDR